jgi:hypothetical protein
MSFRSTLKERGAGFLLLCIMVPMAVLGYLIMVFHGLFGQTARARGAVRALDHFVNSSIFNGHPWESLSSHAWRERQKPWARSVVRLLDLFQKDHCRRANKREQPVVDLVLQKGLHHQTIK